MASRSVLDKQNIKQRRTGANQALWISSKQTGSINVHFDGIPDPISKCNSDIISEAISKANYKTISGAIP